MSVSERIDDEKSRYNKVGEKSKARGLYLRFHSMGLE